MTIQAKILLFCVLLPVALYGRDENKQSSKGASNPKEKQAQIEKALGVPVIVNFGSCDGNQNHEGDKKQTGEKPTPYFWNLAYLIAGCVGAFLTLGTLGFIWWQIHTAKRAERAWVTVELQWPRYTLGKGITIGFSDKPMCICKNDGKTPAWLLEYKIVFAKVKDFPTQPDLESALAIPLGLQSIASGGQTEYRDVVSVHPAETGITRIIYGVVKYRDIFGHNRKTVFGYELGIKNALERLTLPAYNEHT